MKHIFCESTERAKLRLNSILDAANTNLDKVLELVDSSILSCEKCFNIYRSLIQDEQFEKKRILHNFTPEKIYDWSLLENEDILTAYRAVRTLQSAYLGFKAVFFLLKEKVKSDDLWSKVKVSRSEITSKEENFLINYPKSIPYFKAWKCLLPLVSERTIVSLINEIENFLDLENDYPIIEECFFLFLLVYNEYGIKSSLIKKFYCILVRLQGFDLILKNLEIFKEFNIINDVIYKLPKISSLLLGYIIENINVIDIERFIDNASFDSLVTCLISESIFREHSNNRNNLITAFYKISLSVIKAPNRILSTTFDKLRSVTHSKKFGYCSYPLLYISLILDLELKEVEKDVIDPKIQIIYCLIKRVSVESKFCTSSSVLLLINDLIPFVPYSLIDIGLIISKYIKMNSFCAVEFTKAFGPEKVYLVNVVKNFCFDNSSLEPFVKILQSSAPELIYTLKSKAVLKNISVEQINILTNYINNSKEVNQLEKHFIIADTLNDKPSITPFKKVEIVLKKRDSLPNQNMEKNLNLNSLGSSNLSDNDEYISFSRNNKSFAKNNEDPYKIKNVILQNHSGESSAYHNISVKNTSKDASDLINSPSKCSFDILKEIAARSKANNPEKQVILIDNIVNPSCSTKEHVNFSNESWQNQHNKKRASTESQDFYAKFTKTNADLRNDSPNEPEGYISLKKVQKVLPKTKNEQIDLTMLNNKSPCDSDGESCEDSTPYTLSLESDTDESLKIVSLASQKPSSISDIISKRSNSLFSENVDLKSCTKEQNSSSLYTFFDECLLLQTTDLAEDYSDNPTNFDSYQRYYNFFNSLRSKENISAIKIGILGSQSYVNGTVYSLDSVLRIKIHNTKLEINDLLYFSCDQKQFDFSAPKSLENYLTNGAFLGVVLNIQPGIFYNDSQNTDLVDVYVLKSTKKDIVSQRIFFKCCYNISSSYREYLALKNIKSLKILKYLLRPSFSLDFLSGNIHWDDSKQSYIINKKNHIQNEYALPKKYENNIVQLQSILVKSLEINESQAFAVSNCFYSTERFNLIQGPPGTGKTSTILAMISTLLFHPSPKNGEINSSKVQQSFDSGLKILVCAPSNTAIDVFVLRLAQGIKNFHNRTQKINFLRVGVGATSEVNPYTLDYLANLSQENLSKAKLRADLLENAQVVCSTLNSCVSETVCIQKFDIVIIDEACQATEISSIIPLKYLPEKVILIGDPKQLPPTSISNQKALQVSLFERLLSFHKPSLLTVQYRMHPVICNLSSSLFYDSKILTDKTIAYERENNRKTLSNISIKLGVLNFIDIFDGKESLDCNSSFFNLSEAKTCCKIIKSIQLTYKNDLNVCVLSPYKAQVSAIKSYIPRNFHHLVNVNTIDSFQGKECDIVVLSTVRTKGLGFTCDFRRINVAITRAKIGLIILGNQSNLSNDPVWRNIIKFCKAHGKTISQKKIDKFISRL